MVVGGGGKGHGSWVAGEGKEAGLPGGKCGMVGGEGKKGAGGRRAEAGLERQ